MKYINKGHKLIEIEGQMFEGAYVWPGKTDEGENVYFVVHMNEDSKAALGWFHEG